MNPYNPQDQYNPRQWAIWNAFLDVTNAIQFGYEKYRLAQPGKEVNMEKALKNVTEVEERWTKEWHKRSGSGRYNGVPNLSKMPKDAQIYLYSILEKAREIKLE